jgi:LysM repeat protein
MRHSRILTWFVMLLAGVTLLAAPTQRSVLAQGENLLTNPGFEGQYSNYVPSGGHPDCPVGVCTTVNIPVGWWPWWVKERPSDGNPEYKPAEAPFMNRVHGGARAGQYFSFYRTHKAGFFQQVTVPANARLRFTIYGQTWITNGDTPISIDPVAANMRIGIDPTGGSNPYSANIVWSGFQNPYDAYQLFTIEAQARGDKVTVFTFSAPDPNPWVNDAGLKHTDIYWDEASLVVIGAGSAPPPAGNPGGGGPAAPSAPVPVGPTPTPDADGNIYHVVQSGDSMWSIAARAGISLDQFLEYNGLSRDAFIQAGQRLLIGRGQAAAVEPTAEPEVEAAAASNEAAPEVRATAVPSPTPTLVPTPVKSGGDICLMAFDDANQNGLHDAGESLRASVAFTIANGSSVVTNYVTDGASEPKCIQGLDTGSYFITRSKLSNETLTTTGEWAVSLGDGSIINLAFGSYLAAEEAVAMAAAADTPAEEEAAAAAAQANTPVESGSRLNALIIAVVVIALLLFVGVLVVILSARRSTV